MRHLYYESLRRRLNQQEDFPLLEEKIQRAESGIYGEMLVARELSDITLPHFDWIANFQYLSSQNTSYQIDFILILPSLSRYIRSEKYYWCSPLHTTFS